MKYAVIGLGAVGSIIGGLLAKSGEDVVLIGKDYQVKAISKSGLKIDGLNGSIAIENVEVSSEISKVSGTDVIIICVKAQDTQALAISLKKVIKKSAVFISLQNGVRNSKIISDVTGNKAFSGVVIFNALYSKAGEASLTLKGGLILESDDSFKEEAESFIDVLEKFGMKSRLEPNVEGYLWSKLVVNLQNAVTALTGQTIKESILDKDSRKILIETMSEGLSILDKSGISYKTLPDIDPKVTIRRFTILNSTLLKLGSRILKLNETARTSMLQSLSRGRPTEIDYINGEIVDLAKKNNLGAPINTKIVELVKEAEKKHLTKSFEPFELKEILGI